MPITEQDVNLQDRDTAIMVVDILNYVEMDHVSMEYLGATSAEFIVL